MTWTAERRAIFIGALLVAWSVASVRIGFAGFEQRQAVLTLLAGWFVAACGLLTWLQAPGSRTGSLLVMLSAAWFLGGFRWLDITGPGELAGWFAASYQAVAVHAILTFPTGRTRGTGQVAVILAAYAATLLPPAPANAVVTAILSLGLGLDISARGSDPAARRRRWPAWIVGLGLTVALLATQILPVVLPASARFDARLIDQLAMMSVTAALAVPLVRETSRRARVTDLVVDLDPARVGLARELARSIGDPTLRIGYWLPEQRRYVDPTGQTVDPSVSEEHRRTFIERDGAPVAVLIHDPAVTTDAGIRTAIARAATLATANARLQAEARAQAVDVEVSRRRILDAADAERRDLDRRLRTDVEPSLAALELQVRSTMMNADEADLGLTGALEQLAQSRRELAGVTNHLHPRVLDEVGLRGALEGLVVRSPVPAELAWRGPEPTDPAVSSALYFASSEGLTNAVKHAQATVLRLRVTSAPNRVVLEVSDDGVGGASPGKGTGLQGLRDRLEAIGATLMVLSPAGGGTRLVVTIPIDPPA